MPRKTDRPERGWPYFFQIVKSPNPKPLFPGYYDPLEKIPKLGHYEPSKFFPRLKDITNDQTVAPTERHYEPLTCPPLRTYTIGFKVCQTFVSNQVYNRYMPRDHFSQMMNSKSHRHDSLHDSIYFSEAVSHLCGMLYSVVTLKCFFPSAPPPKMTDNPVKDAEGGDQKYTQLPLW